MSVCMPDKMNKSGTVKKKKKKREIKKKKNKEDILAGEMVT